MKTSFFSGLVAICLASSFVGRAQADVDSTVLARYSYPIFALYGQQQFTGTAFFYRSGDTTFLVSNYHAIKGMSPLKQSITFNADTLYLKYPVKNSEETKLLSIDVSDDVTGETEIFSMVDRIDLLKIPLLLPEDAEVHFINDLIDPAYFDAVPEEVIVFGFPTQEGAVPAFYSRQQRLAGNVNLRGFADYDASLRVNFPNSSDSARAILGGTSRYYYFIKPYAAQGYSGAPVLGRFRTAEHQTVYRFVGVIFAGQPLTRQTWAIKGEVAWQYLKGML
ncbi:hypothetical protein LZZ85_14420 [Terrimonas sp. NA20]|uniref:Serine protease n=1 Tax=Terrimonas ginsenosidimutans TaxID=2908004 RepID=A0ABS9KT55_9BACT|nr:hypothetical protein [Terrimonas ginsenosidimutans]MCG2615491.1 hypothetical protein [Terrimonas ginsenosidimutans]